MNLMYGFGDVIALAETIMSEYPDVEFYNHECYPTEYEITLLDNCGWDKFDEDVMNILNDFDKSWLGPEYNISHKIWDNEEDPDCGYCEAKITITRLDYME